MRRLSKTLLVMTAATMPFWPVAENSSVAADAASAPSLVISQLKITSSNGQFVTLYNPANNSLDMSKYQLEYFNNYDLTKATSSRLIALSGTVPPHGYLMINDSALLLCYQLAINSTSLGFASTAGVVEVLAFNQGGAGGPITPALQDYVAWSKAAAAGAQTLPTNTNAWLQRQPVDDQHNPVVAAPGVGGWQAVQPDPANPCNPVSANNASESVPTGMNQLLPPSEPAAQIVNVDIGSGVITPALPAADIGLKAPQLTELLPNPSGADTGDEFIELYNANDETFDLSGFSLQIGLTTLHKYTFAAGIQLAPNSFKAFYSDQTGLSMSNTSGQAKLLDPAGNSLSTSAEYGSAKEAQAWALANGKWFWTSQPTPGAANVIKEAYASKKTVTKSGKSAKTKTSKTKIKASKTAATSSEPAVAVPVHSAVLVAVGGLALIYLAYEYRTDLANRIYQCRQYFGYRRGDRL